MDFFYDGQIRRYVTQFMRIFIGFKYKTGDGATRHVPVMYGDMTRQVASIIKENSENKMPTVPRIACYISNVELDMSRMSDASFVSKLHIRERDYEFDDNGAPVYGTSIGAGYTVERLMPTPFKLAMKADIWTSNTDQKLQLFEQIMVLFNPSLELQTTDNYIDWTSLTHLEVKTINFSSRTIPQGPESEIDICTIEFEMPIYISPPAKVKKLGIVRNVVMNVFSEQGDILGLDDLIYGENEGNAKSIVQPNNVGVLLLKSNNGSDNDYDLTIIPQTATYDEENERVSGIQIEWTVFLQEYGEVRPGLSSVYFLQPNGTEIRGTFVINEVDPTKLLITIEDKPSNTVINSTAYPSGRTTVDAIIDPYKFNPKRPNKEAVDQTVASGTRYLVLDNINDSVNVGNPSYDGPDAWKNSDGSDPVIQESSIIEWTGTEWEILTPDWEISTNRLGTSVVYISGQIVKFDGVFYRAQDDITEAENTVIPVDNEKFLAVPLIFQNLKTGIQYAWTEDGYLKSFEGEYRPGYWRINLDPA
jgi:hypothetical protein